MKSDELLQILRIRDSLFSGEGGSFFLDAAAPFPLPGIFPF